MERSREYPISNKEYPIMKEENTKRKFNLQERFIDYAAAIIKLTENLPETKAGRHICSQILRSGTSPAPKW
jgi:hypothetical protein